jgi:hypothetical protein
VTEIDSGTAVALSDIDHPVRLTREHWALACRIASPASALDLARAGGITLTDAIERLSGLVAAGLCVIVSVPCMPPAAEVETDILRQVLNGLKRLS